MVKVAWLLNLDAERELEGGTLRPAGAVLEEARRRAIDAFAGWKWPGDLLLEVPLVRVGADWWGQAWCPTPGALAQLRAAGVRVPAAPPLAVLQAANSRVLSASICQAIPGARLVCDRGALEATLAQARDRPWMLKRPFGFSGRGRREVLPGLLTDAEARWIDRSLAIHGCLQVEPRVEILREYGLHGWIARTGEVTLGDPVEQRCDARGRWLASVPIGDGREPARLFALRAMQRLVAERLRELDYFGPFGIDAFDYRSSDGAVALQPLGEINARYSMGWFVGMAGPFAAHRTEWLTAR